MSLPLPGQSGEDFTNAIDPVNLAVKEKGLELFLSPFTILLSLRNNPYKDTPSGLGS